MKFQTRLVLFFLPLTIFPIIIASYVFYNTTETEIIKNNKAILNFQAVNLSEKINHESTTLKNDKLYNSFYFRTRMIQNILGSTFILNKNDHLIIYYKEKELYNPLSYNVSIAKEDNSEFLNYVKKSITTDDVIIVRIKIDKVSETFLLSAKESDDGEYFIAILSHFNVIADPLRSIVSVILTVLLIIIILVVIAIMSQSKYFTTQLVNLTNGVEKISKGDLNFQLSEKQKSTELKILVKSFNSMSRNLHEEMTFRKKTEEKLQTSLGEKDILLKEIHHRVKNNMQIISSLLHLQSDSFKDTEQIDNFQSAINRITTMSMIHEQLHLSDDLSQINLGGYINELVGTFLSSGKFSIEPKLKLPDTYISIDQVIPIGLIINELISNSMKHSFKNNDKNELLIDVYEENHNIIIKYSDNGLGPDVDIDIDSLNTLGLQLVLSLSKQLNGTFEIQSANDKITQKIVLPIIID